VLKGTRSSMETASVVGLTDDECKRDARAEAGCESGWPLFDLRRTGCTPWLANVPTML
jgi:hypothetical protein